LVCPVEGRLNHRARLFLGEISDEANDLDRWFSGGGVGLAATSGTSAAPVNGAEDAVFTIGPYSFQPSSKLLMGSKGNKVRLTEKETAILRFLYRADQKTISREVLLQEVWGYNSGVTTHTLETHIYRLRQKIEKDAAMPEILATEAGGYKLVP
jgi:DNA-binding response OmpR family regulator